MTALLNDINNNPILMFVTTTVIITVLIATIILLFYAKRKNCRKANQSIQIFRIGSSVEGCENKIRKCPTNSRLWKFGDIFVCSVL